MDNIDVDKLIDCLDNDSNESLLNLTTDRIKEMNCRIVLELDLDDETTDYFLEKLNGYRYVDQIDELRLGAYMRWIHIPETANPELIHLNTGAILVEIKTDIHDDEQVILVFKSPYRNRYVQIVMDQCIIFQKLSPQEKVLLTVLDHLASTSKK